ncbi:Qat anti-phage system TatD family nuclease QatD [Paenirhodobacter populi]|uniref:TatD family deoxyribonuclease n=1 Tax=Paenirhodobacter populi TaxID=2306993 RepID=A0A443IK78_9RHOB|nr:Qat anti-phage system TatD family nuclease QatD [Sinirhodobacter populi]RWR05304.1 TatD family deoxyribonuclease [Sinirhodobacter populi]
MIDLHCHLDLFPRPEMVVREVEAAKIYLLSVTTTPKAFPKTAQLPGRVSRIRTALGLHPQLAHERHEEVGLFCRLISETRYVGEVGLDGGDEFARHLVLQKDVFNRLLRACSDAGGRFLSIHSRHASGEVLEALAAHPGCGTPILHWFSGPMRDAERAVAMGAWFSVGLPMLRSKRAGTLLSKIPRERILTETDAPFASTQGEEYPVQALTSAVAELARHWKCAPLDAEQQILANMGRLIGAGHSMIANSSLSARQANAGN